MLINKELCCSNKDCGYVVKIMTDTSNATQFKKLLPKKCPQCGNKTFKESQ